MKKFPRALLALILLCVFAAAAFAYAAGPTSSEAPTVTVTMFRR